MPVAAASIPEHAVFELTPLDGNPSSRANMQFVLFFQTNGNQRNTASKNMREAYYKALLHYPILHGVLERKTDEQLGTTKVQVSVTKETHEKSMPSYAEFDASELVSDIQKADFNWATWPKPLLSISPIRRLSHKTWDNPLAQCVVTWHADGVGLLISIDHSIADGTGVDILLNQWAGEARAALHSNGNAVSELLLPVDYDHKSVYDRVIKEEPQSDWFIDYVDSVDLAHVPKETGAVLDSDPRGPVEVELSFRANVHSLRIMPESLDRLYSDMCSDINSSTPHVPRIRLAYALVWQRFMAALSQNAGSNDQCFLNIIHSTRHLFERPHYIGNAVYSAYTRQTTAQLDEASIRQLAQTIGSSMHTVSLSVWLEQMRVLQDPERYAKYLTVFASPSAKQLTVSNISRLKFFSVDFGFGAPVHATAYPMLVPGFSVWHPLSASGGLHILWNMPGSVAETLRNDSLFTRYVDFLF